MTPQERAAAIQRKLWRAWTQQRIPPSQQPPGSPDPGINRIAGTFARYAQTQRTAYDDGSTITLSPAFGNALEARVERAIADVVGRGVSGNSSSFFDAVNAAFPVGADGKVAMAPATAGVSSYGSADGISVVTDLNGGVATPGPISVEQATLVRQASVIAADALRVLPAIQPFRPEAETDRVEASRGRLDEGLRQILSEFRRPEEPRRGRVNAIFVSLAADAQKFGREAFLLQEEFAVAPDAVMQIANYKLLLAYFTRLAQMWLQYDGLVRSGAPVQPGLSRPLSVRIARARMMLPVVSQATKTVSNSLDAVGFGEREQAALSAEFTNLSPAPGWWLQRMTVGDFLAWSVQIADREGLPSLTDSGEFGLLYITRQSHLIFVVLAGVLFQLRVLGTPVTNVLTAVLTHERVAWALDDLFGQLKELADLEI